MPKPSFISLAPNVETDDVKASFSILFKPWRWKDQSIVDSAAYSLAKIFPGHQAVLTSSGRRAIYDVLQAYKIGAGDEVIIQAFTCIAVPGAIKWTGAKPIYADINPDTYNLNPTDVAKKITRDTKAIIVQHTFGIPGPLAELKKIADDNNLVLIEDCAHALGATYKNQPVGTFGHAAILSFGRDKAFSSVFGGAVISRDRGIITAIKSSQSQLKSPPFLFVTQQLLHPILFSIILPLYFYAALGKVLLVGLQKLSLLSKAVQPVEKLGGQPTHFNYRYSPALAFLLLKQLAKLDSYTVHRRRIVKQYQASLSKEVKQPHPQTDTQPSWLRYPVLVENPKQLRYEAKGEEILLGDWYDSPLGPADSSLDKFDYQSGSCPEAEKVSQHVINLPTHPRLSSSQARAVINLLNGTPDLKPRLWI